MSYSLPHVLVLINLLRRPALLLGKAPSCHPFPVALSACLPRVLLFSCPSRLSARLSTRRAGRFELASALFAITVGVRMSCGCHATAAACSSVRLRSACLSPRSLDTDGGEGSGAMPLLASFGSLLSAALVSV